MINRMMKLTTLGSLVLISGCSLLEGYVKGDSDRGKGASEAQGEYYVRVWLDGHECQHGDAFCEIGSPVSVTPKLKYEITESDKLGQVSSVIINVFREVDGNWTSNADFIVIAADTSNPDAQMKPGEVYPLGAPPESIRIMDGNGNTLEGMKLASGMKYLMNFVIRADQSETVGVVFTTR